MLPTSSAAVRRRLAAATLLVSGAALVVVAGRSTGRENAGGAPAVVLGSATAPPGEALPAAERERRRAEVEAFVAQKNREYEGHRLDFTSDGWEFVDAPPPDPALAAGSPELLGAREAELRAQLVTAPPGVEHLGNVVAVATRARDASTRVAAIEAIAAMGPGEPQRVLLDVMQRLDPDDPARRALVSLVRPASVDDPFARDVAALLDAPSVAPDERSQIAMTLATTALLEDRPLPDDLLGAMSPDARALCARMMHLAQKAP
jgi:hypothetical protein